MIDSQEGRQQVAESIVRCWGCGAKFPKGDGVPNRYGVASGECWQAFNELLAHERTLWGYPDIHRLVVDAYAVQHPQNAEMQQMLGISKRFAEASVQSVAMHLIALHFALVERKPLKDISALMGRILSKDASFPPLLAPKEPGRLTVADAPKNESFEAYAEFAWQWAEGAWEAWSHSHGQVQMWISQYLGDK